MSNDEVNTQDKFTCEHKLPFVLLSDKVYRGAEEGGERGEEGEGRNGEGKEDYSVEEGEERRNG